MLNLAVVVVRICSGMTAPSYVPTGPYVRILLVSSRNGKVLKRKRTLVRSATRDPEFGEVLYFDVTYDILLNSVFIVMVLHQSDPLLLVTFARPPAQQLRVRPQCLVFYH